MLNPLGEIPLHLLIFEALLEEEVPLLDEDGLVLRDLLLETAHDLYYLRTQFLKVSSLQLLRLLAADLLVMLPLHEVVKLCHQGIWVLLRHHDRVVVTRLGGTGIVLLHGACAVVLDRAPGGAARALPGRELRVELADVPLPPVVEDLDQLLVEVDQVVLQVLVFIVGLPKLVETALTQRGELLEERHVPVHVHHHLVR